MHMADALISPAVGASMWAATGIATVYCAKKVREELDESKIPLMGVAGAFVFAAQMLNFAIPGTGSSGHLGGGLLLAALLGPHAAFLVMASVLGVQALFFADGGLLALGANIFNLGFFPAFIACPLIYKTIVGGNASVARIFTGSLIAAVVGLQLGSLAVVLETTLSGVSELPFATFALVMQPIHLAIGIVEGLVTAGVVVFVRKAQPEILDSAQGGKTLGGVRMRPVLLALAAAALVCGAFLSWFASANPDGLEWSIARVTGSAELAQPAKSGVHDALSSAQEKTALLPDYALPAANDASGTGASADDAGRGTSLSGVVGAAITLALAAFVGVLLKRRSARRRGSSATIGV